MTRLALKGGSEEKMLRKYFLSLKLLLVVVVGVECHILGFTIQTEQKRWKVDIFNVRGFDLLHPSLGAGGKRSG